MRIHAAQRESRNALAAAQRSRPHDATWSPVAVVSVCIAIHLLASAMTYRSSVTSLYTLLEASPRLLALETGLVRLLGATIFLPPLVPTALLASVCLWTLPMRRDPSVARWLALAVVPLAGDSVMRAIGVAVAPAPSVVGDLMELSIRMSPGVRMMVELMAAPSLGAGAMYWLSVLTMAAGLSAYCVARALLAAERAALDPTRSRRRRGAADALVRVQCAVMTAATWLVLAAVGRIALPFATQLFLQLAA